MRCTRYLRLPVPAASAMIIEIASTHTDGKTHASGGVVTTSGCFGDVERAGLVVAADVIAGNNTHADVAMNLWLAIIGIVTRGLV